MQIYSPYEWRPFGKQRPGKIVEARIEGDELVIRETWLDDFALNEAASQRERPHLVSPDLKPLAVIPQSVQAKAMKEGWFHDDNAWRRWANDVDNRSLRTTDGQA